MINGVRFTQRFALWLLLASLVALVPSVDAATPVTVVTKAALRLYNGPDGSFRQSISVPAKATLDTFKRTPDNAWIQVDYARRVGWLKATQVTVNGNLNTLPAVQAVKSADVRNNLANYCKHPVPIPAAPTWIPLNNSFHPNIDTILVHDALTDKVSPMNQRPPFSTVQSDLPTTVLCLTDLGNGHPLDCAYMDTVKNQPFTVHYALYRVQERVLSVETGQEAALDEQSGAAQQLSPLQMLPTTYLTNEVEKHAQETYGFIVCPFHANPALTNLGGAPVTPGQLYGVYSFHYTQY